MSFDEIEKIEHFVDLSKNGGCFSGCALKCIRNLLGFDIPHFGELIGIESDAVILLEEYGEECPEMEVFVDRNIRKLIKDSISKLKESAA
jgi:hypothetical protein